MEASVLRILDANANRAREALRVIEDYARFSLDDGVLCAELKGIRHDLSGVIRTFGANAILHRDTPGDVGTVAKTQAEFERESENDVVTAAGKRLGEALRTIEEYLKSSSQSDARKVESLRYRFYDAEQQIAFTLRPSACGFADKVRLYVLITEATCKRPWLEVAKQAIEGGADCLQLREKSLESGELLTRARALVQLCKQHKVISIINDRPDIALMSDADGVHVGQTDLPARETRQLIGTKKILGVSTHNLDQAKKAALDSADYIGVGPFFKSQTKPRDFCAGPTYAREVVEKISIPAVAIAGINEHNIHEVLATGIKAVAVTAAVAGCDDPRGAAARLKQKLISSTMR